MEGPCEEVALGLHSTTKMIDILTGLVYSGSRWPGMGFGVDGQHKMAKKVDLRSLPRTRQENRVASNWALRA